MNGFVGDAINGFSKKFANFNRTDIYNIHRVVRKCNKNMKGPGIADCKFVMQIKLPIYRNSGIKVGNVSHVVD